MTFAEWKDRADIKILSLERELKSAKVFKGRYELLCLKTKIQVCESCSGFGGGYEGNEEAGFCEWDCSNCDGTGFVEFVAQEKKENF